MERRHIIRLQGREFVTYEGLLDEAHKRGLRAVRTTVIQLPAPDNGDTAIVRAEVELADAEGARVFTGLGDASPRNVSRAIVPHVLRMAETRAKARALRDATNIGMTAIEELSDTEEFTAPAKPPTGLASRAQIDRVGREMKRVAMSPEAGRDYLLARFKKASRSELTSAEIEAFLVYLKALPDVETA